MNNPYIDLYTNQAGTGLISFAGYRYPTDHNGNGFFSTLFNNIIKPLGKYFGKQALSTGIGIGSDFLKGENIKESAKKRLKQSGEKVMGDAISRARKFAQTGKGRKKKRKLESKAKTVKRGRTKSPVKKRRKKVTVSRSKKKPKRKMNINSLKNLRKFTKKSLQSRKSEKQHLSHIF